MRRLLIALVAAFCACVAAAAAPARVADDPLQPQEWFLAAVGADRATPPGPGVPVAIVDSGVDPTHPEFAGRPDTTFLNDQTVTGPEEFHGTEVASVAAAPANGVGMVGVYPQASLEVWDASPTGPEIAPFVAATGIARIADHCPAVINISWGGASRDPQLTDAILLAQHRGCLVVAAAGNEGDNGNPIIYPAAQAHVLAVGGVDEHGDTPPFASFGPWIDVAAPATDIVAAVPLSHDPSGYETSGVNGTSFAAPIVTAAAAWIWTARPTLSAEQVFELLRRTAKDVGQPGPDLATGFGEIDIPAALAAPAPPADPEEPNDDVDQIEPGALFSDGEPLLTTSARTSGRIAATLDATKDPRDLYRIWVPPHRTVRASVSANGDAAYRIWGPQTVSLDEGLGARRRDLKGPLVRAGRHGFVAYVEVLLTGRSEAARYTLRVTASRR